MRAPLADRGDLLCQVLDTRAARFALGGIALVETLKVIVELCVSEFDELGQRRAGEVAILVVDGRDPSAVYREQFATEQILGAPGARLLTLPRPSDDAALDYDELRRASSSPQPAQRPVEPLYLDALSDAGGREYLARQANENPGAFMTLLGKVLPTQVTGDEGGPVTYAIITGVRRAAVEDEEQYGNC